MSFSGIFPSVPDPTSDQDTNITSTLTHIIISDNYPEGSAIKPDGMIVIEIGGGEYENELILK